VDGDDQPTSNRSSLDDASSFYDLDHSWKGTKLPSGGGIDAFFAPLVKQHNDALADEMKRQGVSRPEDIRTTNRGAYENVEARQRQLQAEGYTMAEARQIARDENPQAIADTEKATDPIGDRIENIMGVNRRVHAGGGGGNVTKIKQEPIFEPCKTCGGHGVDLKAAAAMPKDRRFALESLPVCIKCKGEGKVKVGSRTVMVQLLGAKSAGGGGGSGGGKMKRDKKGGAAYGEGYILASYGGRYETIEEEPRTEFRTARVTQSTDEVLDELEQETGVNTAGLLAAVATLRKKCHDPNAQIALAMLLGVAPAPKQRRAS